MPFKSTKIRRPPTPRQRGWPRVLTDRDRIRVEFTIQGKKVVAVGVIQYEAEIDGKWIGLIRFDMAHGFFHRDVLRPDGTQEKTRVDYRTLAEAVPEALDFIETRCEFFRRIYEEHKK